jgi:hypothetical protein
LIGGLAGKAKINGDYGHSKSLKLKSGVKKVS